MCINLFQLHPSIKSDKNPNLGVLLMDFFEFYGRKFNYNETCISVTDGGRYFSRDEIPSDEFMGTRSDLCIKNPLKEEDLYLNPSHSSLNIKPAFECGYFTLSAAMSNCKQRCILDSIVRMPDKIAGYRSWIHNKFG